MLGVDADVYETDPNTPGRHPDVDPEEHEGLHVRGDHGRGRGHLRLRGLRRHAQNDGVGIAPFHNFEGEVSPELAGKLDEVKAGIIDGSIKVTSYLAP